MPQGTIQNIEVKMVTTKYGNKPTYTLTIDGDRYSGGFTKPAGNIGDVVSYEFSSGKYGNELIKGSLSVVGSGGGSSAPAPHSAPSKVSSGGYGDKYSKPFPIPALHGDRSIIRQNSLTNARELVMGNAREPLTDDEMAQQIIRIARLFEAYSCGDTEREAVEKDAALKAAVE